MPHAPPTFEVMAEMADGPWDHMKVRRVPVREDLSLGNDIAVALDDEFVNTSYIEPLTDDQEIGIAGEGIARGAEFYVTHSGAQVNGHIDYGIIKLHRLAAFWDAGFTKSGYNHPGTAML